MSHSDDELLSRHIDGELSELEEAALQRRLEQEPQLANRLQDLSRVDSVLQNALAGIPVDPPAHLVQMLQAQPDNVIPLRHTNRPLWLTAVAASLLAGAGFLVGQQWQRESLSNPQLPDVAAVSAALESHPSSTQGWVALDDGYSLRPVLSFADQSGAYCREYELSGSQHSWRGVACREQGKWQTRLLVNSGDGRAGKGHYRTAGAETAAVVSWFIDQHIEGIPLGAEDESARILAGWE